MKLIFKTAELYMVAANTGLSCDTCTGGTLSYSQSVWTGPDLKSYFSLPPYISKTTLLFFSNSFLITLSQMFSCYFFFVICNLVVLSWFAQKYYCSWKWQTSLSTSAPSRRQNILSLFSSWEGMKMSSILIEFFLSCCLLWKWNCHLTLLTYTQQFNKVNGNNP